MRETLVAKLKAITYNVTSNAVKAPELSGLSDREQKILRMGASQMLATTLARLRETDQATYAVFCKAVIKWGDDLTGEETASAVDAAKTPS